VCAGCVERITTAIKSLDEDMTSIARTVYVFSDCARQVRLSLWHKLDDLCKDKPKILKQQEKVGQTISAVSLGDGNAIFLRLLGYRILHPLIPIIVV
jgi:hypothetical protein